MPHGRSTSRIFVYLVLLMSGSLPLFAAHGHIDGRVSRQDGSGIGGVIVQVVQLSLVEATDSNGSFRFEIPPGTYTLEFTAGEQVASQQGVSVVDGQTTKVDKVVDWKLSLAETITVYSASRRTERVVDAPASVTVAAPEQIAAAAPGGQAPRIIENAPGVDFTQSGLYDFNFNARGFNSSLNRRVLTLIDGRDPSVPFLGSQEWAALSFPIDEMASVELVRGPGSALYGPNAFSGVLNMTTKRPKDSEGGRLILTGGELSTKRADIRHAGSLGGDWFYRVVGGWQQGDDFTRSRNAGVEYPGLRAEARALALDEVNIKFGGVRFDRHFADTDVLTIEAGLAQLEGPVFQTGIGRVQVTDVERPWARVNYNMPRWNFSAYYDARKAEDQVALASGAGLWEDSQNLNAEVQTNWDFFRGRTRVVMGAAYNEQEVDTANAAGVQTLMAEAKSESQQSAFGQLEFDLTKTLKFVGAARWDDSTLHEAQFSPKAALVWSAAQNHTLRYGYNEAFQRPNYSELFLVAPAGAPVNLAGAAALNPQTAPLAPALTQLGFGPMPILARGNENLDVEKVQSHEIGYAGIFGGKLFLTVDYYRSHMEDFVTDLIPGVNSAYAPYVVPASLPAQVQAGVTNFLKAALGANYAGLTTVGGKPALVFSYTNAGKVDTQGAELAFNYYLSNRWVLDFNYSWFDFDVKDKAVGDQLLPNAPERKYNAGVSWRGDRLDAHATYRSVDEFQWAAGIFVGEVPSYDVVNLGARLKINPNVGIGLDVTNALDDEHWETFGGDILSRRALGFVTLSW
jgi:outer membrane receptor for ferrienterochelin and colicins